MSRLHSIRLHRLHKEQSGPPRTRSDRRAIRVLLLNKKNTLSPLQNPCCAPSLFFFFFLSHGWNLSTNRRQITSTHGAESRPAGRNANRARMRNHDPRSNWQSGSANESGSERGRQQGRGPLRGLKKLNITLRATNYTQTGSHAGSTSSTIINLGRHMTRTMHTIAS